MVVPTQPAAVSWYFFFFFCCASMIS